MTWPLWVDGPDFPRVPFVRGWPDWPSWASRLVLAGASATLAMASIGLLWRPMLASVVGLLAFAILGDQNRFQPWAYQFGSVGLAMALVPRPRALAMARWYAIGLYFYSGLSKLDASFLRELGPTFLEAGLRPLGISAGSWSGGARVAALLAMPAFEVGVAALLARPSTRKVGLAGAIGLHLALLAILGPWNLGHSPGVLAWNLAMIVEDLILFWPGAGVEFGEVRGRTPGRWAWVPFSAVLVFPAGERLGLADAWPAHALYASHCERPEVWVHEDDADRHPDPIRRRLGPAGLDGWRRLDLTGWSRDVRGAPVYPSNRIGVAVAEDLEARSGGVRPVRLVLWGRASPLEGARERVEAVGLPAIREAGRRFALNARPAGISGP